MIRDTYLRLLFIPLLGIFLPVVSGIITYRLYSVPSIIGANLYFILTSFIIWRGCNWIHTKIRPLYASTTQPFLKIIGVSFTSAIYGACIGTLSTMAWLQMSKEIFHWNNMLRFILVCIIAVIVFTLIYEILFLSKERELDTKIVVQLDRERSQAELQALQNEMDPHFIFNSLNTLNHLILNDPQKAHLYNNKLAQVYKYFLINKNRELISLNNELEFINDYFFLLQLRHDNKLQLESRFEDELDGALMIPPCSLQVLIENAIKHNEFSSENPLLIAIVMNGQYLKVINNMRPKPYAINSTNIGLKNLSSRYKLLCNKDIVIERSKETFTVKLPMIR
ncbi:MAG: histidine kinase [Bacteroidia bacterium]|nr:histidine kinase [Bacteroidia bacterium]